MDVLFNRPSKIVNPVPKIDRLIEAFGVGVDIGIGIETDNEKTDSDTDPDFRPRISAKTLIFMRLRVRHKVHEGLFRK